MIRRALVLVLPLLLSLPAHAADEDDIAPLVPTGKPKSKAKPKPKAKPAKPAPAPVTEDDLVPLAPAGKTELLVKLNGDIQGAKLFIDNKEVGTLPMSAQPVSAGDHAVLVKRPGFAAFTKKVVVAANKTVEVKVDLKASMGVLSITSEPSGAQVFIAGRAVGYTPLQDFEVAPGNVTVVAKKDGYNDAQSQLTARAGQDSNVSLRMNPSAVASRPTEDRPQVSTLTPENSVSQSPVTAETQVQSNPPIVTRWYFWVGVVAVAGAIAAGTAIGVSQANTTKPLTQQEICGGPCDACINCSAAFKF
jgi:hypothetical protein